MCYERSESYYRQRDEAEERRRRNRKRRAEAVMGINNTTARGLSLFGFLVHSVRFLRLVVNWNYNVAAEALFSR